MKSLPEQLASARRELALRRQVYPRWIESGRLKEVDAAHEIECMLAIVATLEKLIHLQEVSEEICRG